MLWRDKQIEYTRLVTTSNDGAHYQPVLGADARRPALRVQAPRRWSSRPSAKQQLMNQYRHLSAFPENREVLQALKARAASPPASCRNGDPEMLGVAVRSAGLEGLLDHVLSVDTRAQVQDAPRRVPRSGRRPPGCARDQILFVSCNAWDALGATWFGYRTLWVNRYRLPFEELGTQPTRIGTTLRDVLDFFS